MVLWATLVLAPASHSQPTRHRIVPTPTLQRVVDPGALPPVAVTTLPHHRTDANDSSNVEARWRNAAAAWDAGAYLAALDSFHVLLRGEDSTHVVERIALLTGERWATSLIAENARAPRWSPDGRWIAMEIGVAASRVTRLMTPGVTPRAIVDVKGGALVFSPDGRRAAYVTSRGATDDVIERDLTDGTERTRSSGTLRVAQLAYSIDGSTLFVIGANATATRTQLYQLAADRPEMVLMQSDSVIADLQIVAGGRQLVVGVGGRNPLGTGTGTAFARGTGRLRFGVYDLATKSRRDLDGELPVVAADGSAMAFIIRRDGRNHLYRLTLSAPGEPELLHTTVDSLTNPAISPDGRRVVFQQMPRFDWELYAVTRAGESPTRITREIQHDLLPRFLDDRRVLAVVGEARHRRAFIYDLATGARTRLFHNNTVRTIAPEYEWAASPDATNVLVVAERDGDTVTPHRHLWLVDLSRPLTVDDVRKRVTTMRASEAALRAEGARRFAPIAAAVRAAVADVSTERVYAFEKALFDFDSKHITRPGNLKAREYLLTQYRSFGLPANPQPFEARVAVTQSTVPTANILAVLKGTENPELVYVVGSHFDSRAEGPGADDNTSGTAALLEAARVLSRRPQPATIIFASFTGEESGLLGSREFVRRAKADSMRLVGALNNDMLGWSNDQRLDNTIRYSNPGIRDLQHAAAFLFTRMITYDAFYYKSTDAAAFYDGYGDIVGGIGSYPVLGNPHYHQPHDELEFENHQLIAEAAKTTVASLMLLASSPSRIGGVTARAGTNGASVTWTPSPERGIVRYQIRYGPPDDPERWAAESTAPRVVLPRATTGMTVAVRAVNRRGLEGWDWGRAVVQ